MGSSLVQLDLWVSTDYPFVFHSRLYPPDEERTEGGWHFLRFGEVFFGLPMADMVDGLARPGRTGRPPRLPPL